MSEARRFSTIERDYMTPTGFRLVTSSCGCCATDVTYPPMDWMTEYGEYVPPTDVELDMLRDHLQNQLALIDQLRAAMRSV